MVTYAKVKFQGFFWVYDKNWQLGAGNCHFQAIPCVIEKFRLIVFPLYIQAITRISPEFSELSLRPDTQSSGIWSIPPRLKVLPLTQKYQTKQKDFYSKMPDRRLHVYSAQITSLQLNQVTPQPEFNLNIVTCIDASVCGIMFYYFGGDLRHE